MATRTKAKRNKSPEHLRRLDGLRLRRKILIAAMGGRCETCGTHGTDGNGLEFHHTEARTWCTRDLSRWSRMRVYEEEWEQGRIILLCADCNKRAGQPDDGLDDVPF